MCIDSPGVQSGGSMNSLQCRQKSLEGRQDIWKKKGNCSILVEESGRTLNWDDVEP